MDFDINASQVKYLPKSKLDHRSEEDNSSADYFYALPNLLIHIPTGRDLEPSNQALHGYLWQVNVVLTEHNFCNE